MRTTTLAIGTFAILYWLLDMMLDMRGASEFVRPYHLLGLLSTVAASTLVLIIVSLFWKARTALERFLMALLYLHLVIIMWAVALPLGDRLAIREERLTEDIVGMPDFGPGWYYVNDSGMGGDPMSILYFAMPYASNLVGIPLLLVFVVFTFYLDRFHGKTRNWQDPADARSEE